jgi:hypothetical protein
VAAAQSLPEVRRLTNPELEELHLAKKEVQEDLKWSSAPRDTIRFAEADLWVANHAILSFGAQCTMRLFLKVVMPVRPKRLNYFYRVKATGQVVRMYHSDAHHDEFSGLIPGPHKHVFEEYRRKHAYAVSNIRSRIMQAVKDFFKEENITTSHAVQPLLSDPTLSEFPE